MSGAALDALSAPANLSPEDLATERGHTARGWFTMTGDTFHLAHAPSADLDDRFVATCLETGEHLAAYGWMFEAIREAA